MTSDAVTIEDLAQELALESFDPDDTQGGGAAVVGWNNSQVQRNLNKRAEEDMEQKAISSRQWLVSLTDLFSILMCFFVLVYSMRDPDIEKVAQVFSATKPSSIAEGTGQQKGAGTQMARSINQVSLGSGANLDYLEGVLKNILKQANLMDDVRLVNSGHYLKLVVSMKDTFDAGGLSRTGTQIAQNLAERLRVLPNRISVVAVPDGASAWAESLERAQIFANSMRESGYRKTLTILGLGNGARPEIEVRVESDDGFAR